MKSRPRGSRSNTSLERLVARVACVIARRGEPATTSTRSAMPAGRSVRSIVNCAPSTSATSATLAVSNPSSRAAIWYRPGGSAGYRYPPAASVTISSARPFSLETATAAPGRTPPCTSRTTPWTDPVCSWPAAVAAARRQQVTAAAMSRCTGRHLQLRLQTSDGSLRKGVIATPARRPIRGTGRVRGRIRLTTRRWAPP